MNGRAQENGEKKEVLIAPLGESPQAITECLDLLLLKEKGKGGHITEVVVLYTQDVKEYLCGGNHTLITHGGGGWKNKDGVETDGIQRWNTPYRVGDEDREITLTAIPIRDLHKNPVKDIRNEDDDKAAEETIYREVLKAKKSGRTVHICLAGGRRSETAYLTQAAQYFTDEEDGVYHVLASKDFENSPKKNFHPQPNTDDAVLIPVEVVRLYPLIRLYKPDLDEGNINRNTVEDILEMGKNLVALGMFARGIHHEAWGHLNQMSMLRDLINENKDKDEKEELVQQIWPVWEEVESIITSFLGVISPAEIRTKFKCIDVKEIIEEVRQREKKNNWPEDMQDSFSCKEADGITVKGERSLLKRSLGIVIRNAIESMEKLSTKKLSITLKKENDQALISIQDIGKGIPLEIRDKIFNWEESTKESGLKGRRGFGLPLAKLIAREIHKGDLILLNLKENTGSTFQFSFPLS